MQKQFIYQDSHILSYNDIHESLKTKRISYPLITVQKLSNTPLESGRTVTKMGESQKQFNANPKQMRIVVSKSSLPIDIHRKQIKNNSRDKLINIRSSNTTQNQQSRASELKSQCGINLNLTKKWPQQQLVICNPKKQQMETIKKPKTSISQKIRKWVPIQPKISTKGSICKQHHLPNFNQVNTIVYHSINLQKSIMIQKQKSFNKNNNQNSSHQKKSLYFSLRKNDLLLKQQRITKSRDINKLIKSD